MRLVGLQALLLSRRSWEAAVLRIASFSTSHRFVVANMLPLSLRKTAQGHPILIFLCLLLSNCQKLILS
ncbi:unnamed protein product [Sphagnum tenellum]